MKAQAFNPYLPSYEYIPDGEPYVFGDRLYIYGSHDCFDGTRYCFNDYVCWSAPADDLSDWRYEGVIYRKNQDPMNAEGKHCLYAPDVAKGPDGRYYLYYALDRVGVMAVAVCDSPAGQYKFYGFVKRKDGTVIGEKNEFYQFDPGIFIDDDGKIFLYTGFATRPDTKINAGSTGGRPLEAFGSFYLELEKDMLTSKFDMPKPLIPVKWNSSGTGFEGHEFFEASSMRKIGGKYYFVYSSINSHELCYATSDKPDGGFVYGGTLISIGDVFLDGRAEKDALNYMGNTHGGMVNVKGQWYIFYHRQTNLHQYSRQACAEKIYILPDGSIKQVEMTSNGLNPKPLLAKGVYAARIACNLRGGDGCFFYSFNDKLPAANHPYFTQEAADCDPALLQAALLQAALLQAATEKAPRQYIANMQNGAMAGFKYFQFDVVDVNIVDVNITVKARGTAKGKIKIAHKFDNGKYDSVGEVDVHAAKDWQDFSAKISVPKGKLALYFIFEGEGAMDFLSFAFS